MVYTRRRFANLLQAGTAMAVAGFRPRCPGAMIHSDDATTPVADTGAVYSSQHFSPLIGSEFRVASLSGRQVSLTLIAVEGMPRRRPVAVASLRRVDCALLRFSAGGSDLSEGIHRLVHEQFGDYDLYLSPGKSGRYLAYLCR